MPNQIIENYHADAVQSFRNYKKMAERAMEQISEREFFHAIDSEANSIAVIVKHIAGNLVSRWTDFLVSDGEKPDRNRDTEFEVIGDTRESLMEFWERSWQTLFENIEPLTVNDFAKTVTIRGEPHTIVEAFNRQLTHYAYHVGQIVFLAKHYKSADWKTLSDSLMSMGHSGMSMSDSLMSERQFPMSESNSLMSESDSLMSENDVPISESDFLISENEFLISESDSLISENEFLMSENDSLTLFNTFNIKNRIDSIQGGAKCQMITSPQTKTGEVRVG